MKKLFALAAMLTFALFAYSQQENCRATLHLKIVDAASGLGIEDVTAYLPQQQKGNHSNQMGELDITELCTGDYLLICKHLNHEERKEVIQIREGKNVKTVYMTCHTDTLHGITIKGARLHWEATQVIHKIQDKDLFVSQGLSLGKALEKVNGVYNLSTGNHISKPIIRGLHSNRVLILNNEIRQEGQQWGNEHAPEIDQFIAKSIEVVKGAQTIKHGSDVIGGVVLVQPKPLQQIQGIEAEVNTGIMSNGRASASSLLVEGRRQEWKGLAWRLQGTFKKAGNAKTSDYFLKNTGMQEMNYSAAVGYQKKGFNIELFHSFFNTDIAIFAGSHIGNLSDLYQAFNAERPLDSSGFTYKIDLPYQRVLHRLSKVSASWQADDFGTLKFIYAYQNNIRKEFDRNIVALQPDGSYKPSLHFELNTQHFHLSFEPKPEKKMVGEIGMDGMIQSNEYYGSYFIPNFQKSTVGGYLTEKWHHHAFSLEVGLRYDLNHFEIQKWENNQLIDRRHQYSGMAASAALRYQFPFITLHLNGGSTWRAPFVNELYSYGVHHSAASFEIGDSTVVPERSYNASLTMDFNYQNNIEGEVTLYNNYIKNFINMTPVLPATLTIRGAFPTFQFMQTDVNMFGMEFSVTKALYATLHAHLKGNLLLARDIKRGAYLFGMPPARFETDLDYTLFKKDQNNVHFVMNASYTFKQFLVPTAADYVPAPPAYFLLQSELLADWRFAKQTVRMNLGVSNILNTRYRDYLNRNRYFANESGRNIYIRISIPITISKQTKISNN
ncbi:MAG: TonB-dependent receptor [Bacteroidetes bacterium]|nr:TonB-dependent receptor [Bacteroidota bacterium]